MKKSLKSFNFLILDVIKKNNVLSKVTFPIPDGHRRTYLSRDSPLLQRSAVSLIVLQKKENQPYPTNQRGNSSWAVRLVFIILRNIFRPFGWLAKPSHHHHQFPPTWEVPQHHHHHHFRHRQKQTDRVKERERERFGKVTAACIGRWYYKTRSILNLEHAFEMLLPAPDDDDALLAVDVLAFFSNPAALSLSFSTIKWCVENSLFLLVFFLFSGWFSEFTH